MATTEAPSVYRAYKSIWKDIDNCNYYQLAAHPDLTSNINEKAQGSTPLFLACLRKCPQIVYFLLSSGADANQECKSVTPLYLCCLYAEYEATEALLSFGADPNMLSTPRLIAPLHLTALKGLVNFTQLLLKNNADVDVLSGKYGTPLHVAVSKNHINIAKILITHGAALNIVNEEGETPLHIACRAGYLDIVRLILDQQGVNALIKDSNDGNTVLHVACLNNRETIALLLISKYPDLIYIKNNTERQTPLFFASDSVRRAIKNAFVSKKPGFINAVNNSMFSDVRYTVADKKVFAHRVIIHARDPVLATETPNKDNVIQGVDYSVFVAYLFYLYTDQVQCDKTALPKLMKCAKKFNNVRLKKMCLDMTTTADVAVPPSTFKTDMKVAINNLEFSDLTFMLESKPIHGHRIILAQHEYFKAMFNAKLIESQQKQISILGISHEVFQMLINYSYTFEMEDDISPDLVIELLAATDQFMIEGLRHCCQAFLCTCITRETVCQLFQISDLYKSLFLKEECFDALVTDFRTLSTTPEYEAMSDELKQEVEGYINKRPIFLAKKQAKAAKDEVAALL